MQGKVILHERLTGRKQDISVSDYRTGVYMIQIITREESFKSKFIKK
jgi:hypothetical protein